MVECGKGRDGGGGEDKLGWGHIQILNKAPTEYKETKQTMEKPERLNEAQTKTD